MVIKIGIIQVDTTQLNDLKAHKYLYDLKAYKYLYDLKADKKYVIY